MIASLLGLTQGRMDFLTGVLCLFMALALCTLHVISSTEHGARLDLPNYVRVPLVTSGVGMLFRGVDLIMLAQAGHDRGLPGHIDPVGVALTVSMTAFFITWAVHVVIKSNLRRRAASGVTPTPPAR